MANSYNELFGLGSHSEDANLVLWWLCFDDTASTAVDDQSSNANDGTATANTSVLSTTGANSYLTSAFNFNGSSHSISDAPGLPTQYTIAAWVNNDTEMAASPIQRNAFATFAESPGSTTYDRSLFWDAASNRPGAYHFDGGAKLAYGPATTATGSWFHAAGTYDGSQITCYTDGVAGTPTTAGNPFAGYSTPEFVVSRGQGTYHDGTGGEYVLFNRALTGAEVVQLVAGPEPINSVAPVLSGTETQGETLSVTTGTWGLDAPFASGTNGTITYGYQWTRSDDAGGTGEADISGATSSTYTLTASDVGKYIRCRVRGTNDGGFDSAADTNSNMSGAIASSGGGSNIPAISYHRRQLMGAA